MAKKYSDLLRDPRWQKKRLEILQMDKWTCRRCNSNTKTLNVHHLVYFKGKDPWDYPDHLLVTYCEDCHKLAPNVDWKQAFLDLNMTEFELLQLASYFHWIKKRQSEFFKDILNKHNCRYNNVIDVFDPFLTTEEMNEYYQSGFFDEIRDRYTDGEKVH